MKLSDFATGLEVLNRAYADKVNDNDVYAMRRIQDIITIWWDALGADYSFMEDYIDFVRQDSDEVRDYQATLDNLEKAIRQGESRSIEIWGGNFLNTLKTYTEKVQKLVQERIRAAGSSFESTEDGVFSMRLQYRAASLLLSRIENADASHQLRVALQEARSAASDAKTAAESAQNAAGVASSSTLSSRFDALASRHLWASSGFRILTTVGVVVGIWIAFGVSIGGTAINTDTTTGNAILRVALLTAILGLATYFGRQAAYHRDVSTWARTIKEQLLTFNAYMEPVTDETLQHQIRAAFAARVFGPSPESKEDSGVTLTSPVLSEIAAIVAKAGGKP